MAKFDIEKLSFEALEQVSGGATDREVEFARIFIGAAQWDGKTLDEAISELRASNLGEEYAKFGVDLEEVIKVMQAEW